MSQAEPHLSSKVAAEQRPRKGERTRLRILDAAASVLAEQGYAATTLTEIATVAEMQAGSLYYHFDSKDAIVEEVLRVGTEHATEAICDAVAALGPDTNGHDRLQAAVIAYSLHIVSVSNFSKANIRCYEEAPSAQEALANSIREFADLWVDLLKLGQIDGSLRSDVEPRVIARMTIAALNSCVQWYCPGGDLELQEVATMFADALVDGLRT
jgi:AcrR family transcriptional regulator